MIAEHEARNLCHNYIGTEHLLLGLSRENEGVAAQALANLGVTLDMLRAGVEAIVSPGATTPSGHIPFTPRAKKVLELSLREALQLGHNYIGTEHILLGLVREGEGVAASVLTSDGLSLGEVRDEVIKLLSGYKEPPIENPDEEEEPEEEPEPEDEDPWWLVEYVNADGSGSSAIIQADGWETAGPMILVGGHAFATRRVVTIHMVSGPPCNNTVTPAGMKPLAPKPPPAGTPVDVAPDCGAYTLEEMRERKDAILAAVAEANRVAGTLHPQTNVSRFDQAARDRREAEKRRSRRWGDAMGKAVSVAHENMGQHRLAGGIIYVPDDGSAPSYIAPSKEGLTKLDELLVKYEMAVAQEEGE